MEVQKRLLELAEEDYKQFSAALVPGVENMLGIRLPKLQALAKELAKGDWRAYLENAGDLYFEETMLQGMVIGCAKMDSQERLRHVAAFVPKIDNWSVNDSFCAGLKVAEKEPAMVWDFLQPYLASEREYDVRFGAVMLMDHFVTAEYVDRVLAALDSFRHPGYYAQMAVAWALSVCYVKFPEKTLACLKSTGLDDFTFNKALQKAIESRRVTPEEKEMLRGMKRRPS